MRRLADVKVLAWGYKFSREIARRMPHFRGEPAPLHPAFAPGSPASVVAHAEGPVAFDTPRIVYSEEDERALDAYVRKMGGRGIPCFWSFDTDENLFLDVYSVSTCWHSVSPHSSLVLFLRSRFFMPARVLGQYANEFSSLQLDCNSSALAG